MANALLELLSVREWTRAASGEVSYDTTGVRVTKPTPTAGQELELDYRFARVEAHSGDVKVAILANGTTTYTIGTGDMTVTSGTHEFFQLAQGSSLWIAGSGGTKTGAVIWGR